MTFLSKTSESAIRALVVLASLDSSERITADELSSRCEVPRDVLRKIMWKLQKTKLVNSVRGARGGYTLFRSPGSVTLRQIVAVFTPTGAGHGCIFGWSKCADRKPSSPHHQLFKLRESYRALFDETTLSELLPPPH
jgi:Rrf2 family protein